MNLCRSNLYGVDIIGSFSCIFRTLLKGMKWFNSKIILNWLQKMSHLLNLGAGLGSVCFETGSCTPLYCTYTYAERVTFHKLGFCSSLVCIRVPLLRLLDRKKGRSRLRQHRAPDFVASPLPMDPFSLPSSSSASSGQSAPSPEVLMDQLKSQLAQAYAEEFFEVTSLALKTLIPWLIQ